MFPYGEPRWPSGTEDSGQSETQTYCCPDMPVVPRGAVRKAASFAISIIHSVCLLLFKARLSFEQLGYSYSDVAGIMSTWNVNECICLLTLFITFLILVSGLIPKKRLYNLLLKCNALWSGIIVDVLELFVVKYKLWSHRCRCTLKNKGSLLTLMVPWRTFNMDSFHAEPVLSKRFFRLLKCSSD